TIASRMLDECAVVGLGNRAQHDVRCTPNSYRMANIALWHICFQTVRSFETAARSSQRSIFNTTSSSCSCPSLSPCYPSAARCPPEEGLPALRQIGYPVTYLKLGAHPGNLRANSDQTS